MTNPYIKGMKSNYLTSEAVRLNLWCRWVPTPDGPENGYWLPCEKSHPDSTPDLNAAAIAVKA